MSSSGPEQEDDGSTSSPEPGAPSRERILILAGIDPSGDAGLLRDAWAIAACGVRYVAVPTCTTRQDKDGLHEVTATQWDFVERNLRDVARDSVDESRQTIAAVKIGLVPSIDFWRALTPWLAGWRDLEIPVVIDPVRGASAGGFAHGDEVASYLREVIVPLGASWTPNLPELEWLGGDAHALVELGAPGVLVKGGHADPVGADSDEVVDIWHDAAGARRITRKRHPGPERRGTGCTLASFLAVELANGREPLAAAREAGHRLWQCWHELAERRA